MITLLIGGLIGTVAGWVAGILFYFLIELHYRRQRPWETSSGAPLQQRQPRCPQVPRLDDAG